MTGLGKRRRADTDIGSSDLPNPQPERPYPNDALAPATDQDKLTWKGWCEIESEPVSDLIPDTFGPCRLELVGVALYYIRVLAITS